MSNRAQRSKTDTYMDIVCEIRNIKLDQIRIHINSYRGPRNTIIINDLYITDQYLNINH